MNIPILKLYAGKAHFHSCVIQRASYKAVLWLEVS